MGTQFVVYIVDVDPMKNPIENINILAKFDCGKDYDLAYRFYKCKHISPSYLPYGSVLEDLKLTIVEDRELQKELVNCDFLTNDIVISAMLNRLMFKQREDEPLYVILTADQ